MENVFYLLADPMFIVELEHNRWYIRDINYAFTKLTGYKKTELMDADPDGLLRRGFSFGGLMTQLSDDHEQSLEQELISKSTASIPVRFSSRRLPSSEQTCFIMICKDLSEERYIEEYAMDNQVLMSIGVSEQLRITNATRYYSPFKPINLVNHSIFDHVAEESRKPLRRILEYARTHGTTEQTDVRLYFGDQLRMTTVVVKPFFHGNKEFKGYVVLLTGMLQPAREEDAAYKLRMLMLSKNITATSLAQSTLISLTTISKIRNGKIKKPQRLTAELIAGELGVKPESIWSGFKRY
ncbi:MULTISPECIES: helix-turn-helix domain-containing protein [unclassified Paenibacillus]|uniref:helix-turn-helix domain-containing protein n=1 Tax=unclassified Paenibacillus TaxID=185978 RepID=UPI00105353DB|nr:MULTISPECIES: helix-turn-helix domain-containing protein [unclassified Paenibacillus]NIK70913.1 PAS domain S-box-containing protein [Paenibacillus sp. BK720]TCM93110.1 PAS domain S-box-containing protein [Paenibacillus sp. BK033]